MGRAEGETHHPAGVTGRGMMGFAALYPSYVAESPRQASAAIANERLRSAWSKMLAVSSSSSGRWRSTKAEMPARSWSSSPSTVQASDCSTIAFSAGLQNASLSSIGGGTRSEEHTSELQSLMRISYAAFRLHNKNGTNVAAQ